MHPLSARQEFLYRLQHSLSKNAATASSLLFSLIEQPNDEIFFLDCLSLKIFDLRPIIFKLK
jgi:hypothetical protein